ncbi:MAG: hypothetical protein K6F95_01275 [Selenomonas sp.]|uniref:hypothetical protein n=1 Tax=Selenomonas sp. TaxID=2053611 RepID=UPI0025D5EE0D|nr:hypothetical protein [Selenomonas sp.]MCR5756524.1 hypothetical protein [Selenomonas sp.]
MLKDEYFTQDDQTNGGEVDHYLVTWISAGGVGKCIHFANHGAAQRHVNKMEQDGYRAFIQEVS